MKHEARLEGREWHPRDTRVDATCDVTVHCAAGDLPARIVNLSHEGFRLQSQTALEPGWEILLRTGNDVPVKAVVCWASGHEAGGIFAEPVAL